MCSPRSDGARWGGRVGGAGCPGDAVARSRAVARCTAVAAPRCSAAAKATAPVNLQTRRPETMSNRRATTQGSTRKKNGSIWCGGLIATCGWICRVPWMSTARAAHWEQTSRRGCDGVVEWSEESGVAQGFGLWGSIGTVWQGGRHGMGMPLPLGGMAEMAWA